MRDNLLVTLNPKSYHHFATEGTRQWTELLIDRISQEVAEISATKLTLLDVGTGTGHLLLALSKLSALSNVQLIGIDIDHRMVEFAVTELKRTGLDGRITIRQGDVHKLDFETQSINLVVGRSVVHHWAQPEDAFRELYRVLGKDGRAIIHEPVRDPDPTALDEFNEMRRQCGVSPMTTSEKYTVQELYTQLERSGLAGGFRITRGTGIASLGCELFLKKEK